MKTNAKRWSCGVLSGWLFTTACVQAQTLPWAHHVQVAASSISQTASAGSRREADELLRRARSAMKDGDVAQARALLERAEALNVRYEGILHRFADTPEKLRKDLAKADPTLSSAPSTGAKPALPSAGSSAPMMVNGQPMPTNGAMPSRGQMVVNPYAQQGQPLPANLPGVQAAPLAGVVPAAAKPTDPNLAAKKTQTNQLLAMAAAALNRGDLARAEQLTTQAQSLGLGDEAFGPGEMRPWMVMLQIDRVKRQQASAIPTAAPANTGDQVRQAVAQAGETFAAQAVRPASAEEALEGHGPPTQGDPFAVEEESPTGTPAHGSAHPPAEHAEEGEMAHEPPTPDATLSTPIPTAEVAARPGAEELVRRGEAAVKAHDLKKAQELFAEAWKEQSTLSPELRQRLQDNLQMLRSSTGGGEELPAPAMTPAEQELVRRFSGEVSREQVTIEKQLKENPKQAYENLQKLKTKVEDAEIPDDARRQLARRVDRSLQDAEAYIERNRGKIELDDANRDVISAVEHRRKHQEEVDNELAKMVDEFNSLMDQERFSEAVVLAKKARELAPGNTTVESMIWKSRFAERLLVEMSLRERSQQGVEGSLTSVMESGIPFDDRLAIEYPQQGSAKYWSDLTDRRRKIQEAGERTPTQTEVQIQQSLRKTVEVDFEKRPLTEVLDELGKLAGVSIYLDPQGLVAEGASGDMQVTIHLTEAVQLKSALNLILEQFGLTYVVQDEVLKVTSQTIRQSKTETKTYGVADLVIPIPNFVPSYNMGLPSAIREAYNASGQGPFQGGYNQVPLTMLANDASGSGGTAGNSIVAQMAGSDTLPTGTRSAPQPLGVGPGPGGMGGGAQADFDSLIDLIMTTIEPDSWDENGGTNSIMEFQTNLSLVINATTEVHEQIADLLKQLRRLQDLQVTIEVRFITLNDNFFERIGVDFDFDIDDNVSALPPDDTGPSVTVGLDPNGNPTADLDLSFTQGSFGTAVPAFGGFSSSDAANFGFAILSDIEAFFVIQAAQGDTRTNVLQAPKVTLFNGQQASVNDTSQRPFVTSVIPVVGDFAAAQAPVIVVLSEGTSLNVQAVVSQDRRFVRLTLVPFFSKIGNVETFTFEGSRTSRTGTAVVDPTDDKETVNNDAETTIAGTTVQLPQFAFTSVSTTVSVPDGGTILLGGIKRLSEGRNERGVPILSKVPYINRLFKNVGIGRTTQSLMMMVTPRIIIQEEEEEKLGMPVSSNN